MENPISYELSKKYTNDLEKAWKCILPLFFKNCLQEAESGACVTMFRMLPKTVKNQKGDISNCEMYSVPQNTEFWNMTIKSLDNYTELMSIYNHSKHLLIGVTLPIKDKNDSIVGNIRLFERQLEYGKPICLL
jgi:hypothetical protein